MAYRSTRTSIAPAPLALSALLVLVAGCKASASLRVEAPAGRADLRGTASVDADGAGAVHIVRQGDHLTYEDGEIEFETNSTELRGRTTARVLDALAAVLRRYPDLRLRVEGHTDSRGSRGANKALSDGRAQAIRAALIERGIAAERLSATSYGEDRPERPEPDHCRNRSESTVPDDKLDECRAVWAVNRRAGFFIVEGADGLPAAGTVSGEATPAAERPPSSPARRRQDWALRLFGGYSLALLDGVDHHGGHLGVGLHASRRFGPWKRGYVGGGPRLHYRGLRGADQRLTGAYELSFHQLGPEGDLLLGGGTERVVGLFSLRAGLGVSILRGSERDGFTDLDGARLGGWLLGGAMVLAKVAPRWSLGGHAEVGILGVPDVGLAAELGLNAAWHFGPGPRRRDHL